MPLLRDFPYFRVEFNKDAQLVDAAEVAALMDYLAKNQETTDLLVMSHGWNNNMAEAENLYDCLLAWARQLIVDGLAFNRKLVLLGVLWPSKRFTDQQLIPGGAAGLLEDSIDDQLQELRSGVGAEAQDAIDKARVALPDLENDAHAQVTFVQAMQKVLAHEAAAPDSKVEGSQALLEADPLNVLPALSEDPAAAEGNFSGGATSFGGGAGLMDVVNNVRNGAQALLNLTTYYVMKERAGTVGCNGLNPVLTQIQTAFPNLKLHLLGHSFGARLVTAAVAGCNDHPPIQINSLYLVQAAFSHYGFAHDYEPSKDGLFRAVVTRPLVSGPFLVTCTKNDMAVGYAYPLASRLARQIASGLGDEHDKYGGLGRNGAQVTPEAINGELLNVNANYAFQPGKVHNLNSDAFIGGHSDIAKPQVAYAVLKGILST